MEQQKQQISSDSIIYDGLPPISAKYPWLLAHDPNAIEEHCQIFYNLNDPLSKYHCRIPELLGKCIRACLHGWVILSSSDNSHWSLWNSLTSKTITLPPLILKDDGDYESISQCCLSAPPHDPTSVLILTNTKKPTFVFCRLVCKRKRLMRWTEMSYNSQLKRITGKNGLVLHSLSSCNGKVYALNSDNHFACFVIKVDIRPSEQRRFCSCLVKDREVLIKLSLFGSSPFPTVNHWPIIIRYLIGSRTELFHIIVFFSDKTKKTPDAVSSFKLDMTSRKCEEMEVFKGLDMTGMDWQDKEMEDRYKDLTMTSDMWEEMTDLKDAILFVDVGRNLSRFYTTSKIASGFIHIRGKLGEIIYSYNVKNKTIALSSLPCPTGSNVSLWECSFEDNHGDAKHKVDSKLEEEDKDRDIVVRSVSDQEVELNESRLLNLPFPILEMIMELCVCVEYMKFRATCKLCHLAAPAIQFCNETASRRLQTHSFVSPWLMVVDKNQGILTFTDPIFGDSYFMKNLQVSINNDSDGLYCSRFGWLLFDSYDLQTLVFFNPFTNDLCKLPNPSYYIETLCFSAPPTSPDCMVVGFSPYDVFIHFVAGEPLWRMIYLGAHPLSIYFPTFYGRDVYGLSKEGEVVVFKGLDQEDYCYRERFEAKANCCTSLPQYFLVKCDQDLLRIMVSDCGESVVVCKWNNSTEEWEKINSLGRHTVLINDTTCVCIEATIPQMENKIFFPRLHTKNKKIVFYSLETCRYHTFNSKIVQENFPDFMGTGQTLMCGSNPVGRKVTL